ncbi:MAG TPA: type III secretion system outer membrane ring subunit SctC, partial [Burkholderiaceae bacterium]|nr:type III secretion system outer membrane ring subunit SctC [Burkholderiaceae bacterium]
MPSLTSAFPTIRRLAAVLLAFVLAASAFAAPPPYAERKVQLAAREQPIAAFLQDLFGLLDVPVSVSPAVKGAVNGTFNGEAEGIARSISRAFGLVMYYDGAVMHVYTAGEMGARTLPTTPAVADKVIRAAGEMRMADARNTLRTTRDGAVIASGTKRFIEQVEELTRASQVSQVVQPPMGFKVFYLRYAWAHDVAVSFSGRQILVPGVASIVRALVTSSPRSPAMLGQQEQLLRPTQPKLKGQGLGRIPAQPVLGLPDANAQPGTADVLMAAYGGAATGGGGTGGTPLVLGDLQQVRIEADTRLNAIIVRDAPERLPYYEQLVQSLDVEPQSLEIEATIIDINTDKMRELGINWRGNIEKSSVLFGKGDASDLLLQPGGSVIGSAITPIAQGGVISAVLGNAQQFVARISALQTEGAAKVVSSPQVVTLSNVEAVFDSSQTFYVRVAGREEVDLFNVSAGTSLRVTPHVFKDTQGVRIKLLVNLEDGSLSNEKVDALPIVARSSINTQALIYEGESLLIGGLTRESSQNGVEKVPLLGDIPLIGHLFKTQRDGGGRTERMFLISPRLSQRRSAAMGPAPVA